MVFITITIVADQLSPCQISQVLEEDEYEQWLKGRLLAESSIENQEELLQDSAQRLETNLTLLGRTLHPAADA